MGQKKKRGGSGQKAERVLDLLALFLHASAPISFEALRRYFPRDYGGGRLEAASRKFERDKAQLLNLGIALRYVEGEGGGYQVLRGENFLPRLSLTREQWAFLYAAGAAALGASVFPAKEDLAHGLRKMAWSAGETPTRSPVALSVETLQRSAKVLNELTTTLWHAIERQKDVQLEYQSPYGEPTRRRVSPYGLCLRAGRWHCVGHCHLRGALRTFLVHRMTKATINTKFPGRRDFEVPVGFRVGDHVPRWPWQQHQHQPIPVVLRVRGDVRLEAHAHFPAEAIDAQAGDFLVRLQVTDTDALCRQLLGYGGDVAVVEPKQVASLLGEMQRRVLAAHGGGP
jgi:proteasome accessory factor B